MRYGLAHNLSATCVDYQPDTPCEKYRLALDNVSYTNAARHVATGTKTRS